MDFNNLEVGLPSKVDKLIDCKKRRAYVRSYNNSGFIVEFRSDNKTLSLLLESKLLHLEGDILYSLPCNDKHEDWTERVVKILPIKGYDKIKEVWSNIKPKTHIYIFIEDDKIIHYETIANN